MKLKYSREVHILLTWLSDEPSNYADETNGVITFFIKDGKPVMIEIQGAREFAPG